MEDAEMMYFNLQSSQEVLHLKSPNSPAAIEKAVRGEGGFGSVLDDAARWASKQVEGLLEPGLQLHISLRPDDDLLHGHNLLLYALEITDRVKAVSGTQFSSVKTSKGRIPSTALCVSSCVRAEAPTDWVTVVVKTRKSYAKPDFARVVYEAIHAVRSEAARPGPLRVRVSYLTGLPRTWSRLWQPTISSIFASAPNSRNSVNPDTARIIELDFDHRSVGASMEHQVQIAVSIKSANI